MKKLRQYWNNLKTKREIPRSIECVFCGRGTGVLLFQLRSWRICFACIKNLKMGEFFSLQKRRERGKIRRFCFTCGIENNSSFEKIPPFLEVASFIGKVFLCPECEETAMRCSCCALPWLQSGKCEICPVCGTGAKKCAVCGRESGLIYSNNLLNPICCTCVYFRKSSNGASSPPILDQQKDENQRNALNFLECYSCGVILPDYRFQDKKVCKLCAPHLISTPEEAKRIAEEVIQHLNQKFGLFFSLNIPTFLPVRAGKEPEKYDLFYLKDILDASQGKFDLSSSLLVPDVCKISRNLFPYWIAWLIGKRLLKKNLPLNPPYYLKSLPHRIMYEIAEWKGNEFRKYQILKKHGKELIPYFALEKKYGSKEVMAFSFRCASEN